MKVLPLMGEGLVKVTLELNIFELQALVSKMEDVVKLTVKRNAVTNVKKQPKSVSSTGLNQRRSQRLLSSLTMEEANDLFKSIEDVASFIGKVVKDTPTTSDVNDVLFGVEPLAD